MRYGIVKHDNLYVIVIEGQGLMKMRSRRDAAKLLAAAFGAEYSRSGANKPDAAMAKARESGLKDSSPPSASFVTIDQ